MSTDIDDPTQGAPRSDPSADVAKALAEILRRANVLAQPATATGGNTMDAVRRFQQIAADLDVTPFTKAGKQSPAAQTGVL